MFMKYLGSKRRIADDILPLMLSKMSDEMCFVDAFCGGCSIIEKVPSKYRRIANDNNKYLIEMWKKLSENGIEEFPTKIDKDFYADVRKSYREDNGKYSDSMIGWVGFMASFNGRFFDGGYSGHNVKVTNGKSRDYIRENIDNITKQIENIKGVEFVHGDYFDVVIPDNSLIYCDIPYKDTKQYSTSLHFDYEMFYEWCRKMKNNGHLIFVSEYDMPDDFKCIWQKEITNAIHQNNTYKPTEKLYII